MQFTKFSDKKTDKKTISSQGGAAGTILTDIVRVK